MSHMIDESNSRANIAYVGAKPWHGLGQELTAGADLETWRREAGLDWTVREAAVQYQNGELRTWDGRKVLYRSDNGAPLSVMANGYNVVQPADVMNLYSEIAKAGGFTLETAGSLDEGRRIWALAKIHDGADVVARDRVRPYVLVATSFDGSMATMAKFAAVRVVCHNTITQAVGEKANERQEARIVHSVKWDEEVAKRVRLQLGIVHSQFERFMIEAAGGHPLLVKTTPDGFAGTIYVTRGETNTEAEYTINFAFDAEGVKLVMGFCDERPQVTISAAYVAGFDAFFPLFSKALRANRLTVVQS